MHWLSQFWVEQLHSSWCGQTLLAPMDTWPLRCPGLQSGRALYTSLHCFLGSFLCISSVITSPFSWASSFLVTLSGGWEMATNSLMLFPLRGVVYVPFLNLGGSMTALVNRIWLKWQSACFQAQGWWDWSFHYLPLKSLSSHTLFWPVAAILWGRPCWSVWRGHTERQGELLTIPNPAAPSCLWNLRPRQAISICSCVSKFLTERGVR